MNISLGSFLHGLQKTLLWLSPPERLLGLPALALISVLVMGGVTGCTTTVRRPVLPPEPPRPLSSSPSPSQVGVASWYGPGFEGRRTASGERFRSHELTAAHRSLPLGSQVTVTNPANGKSVRVRINDRGPYIRGRTLDLSRAAARQLGLERRGVGRVRITVNSRRGTGSEPTVQRASLARSARRQRPPQTPPLLGGVLSGIWPF
jgi:rare lipoprotein A